MMAELTRQGDETIGQHIARHGVSRRDFVLFCAKLMVAAPFGLSLTGHARAAEVAREVAKARPRSRPLSYSGHRRESRE
jgi:hypothetical protein